MFVLSTVETTYNTKNHMSTAMENAKKINVHEEEISLSCAEQLDVPQTKVEQQANEVTVNQVIVKPETTYNSATQTNGNNVDVNLDYKELKNEPFQVYKDKIMKHEETSMSIKNNITLKEEESIVTTGKTTSKANKRASSRKTKKDNQLSDDKNENLKKVNSGKVVKQKAPSKKSSKTSSKLTANKILKQEDKESLEKYKLELYKINTEGCSKCNLLSFTPMKSETKMYNTKFSCPNVTRQQELNQYGLENNMNVLQHLDYNNVKYTNQQTMPATNSWMSVPRTNENFVLNNSINNTQTQTAQSDYVNDEQYQACAVDYSLKQAENPYFNSVINSTDPYKLLPENKTCYPCSVYSPNCIWNNVYKQNISRTNATFQPTHTTNVAPNYTVLPVNTSNNFLNPTATPFNPLYYYQSLLMDENFKKLYYANLSNNNGCELMVKKENVMPVLDNWHTNSLIIPSNSSLNIPSTTPTWYNAPSSSFVNTSTSTISDADKVQYEQNAYLTNHNVDMTKANVQGTVYKDYWQEKDQFASYMKPAFQNTLPAITTILTTPIDTHALGSYKADDGLTSTLTHQNSTATSTSDSMISNIANLPSETTAVNVSEELRIPCTYNVKDKKLISEILESIL